MQSSHTYSLCFSPTCLQQDLLWTYSKIVKQSGSKMMCLAWNNLPQTLVNNLSFSVLTSVTNKSPHGT